MSKGKPKTWLYNGRNTRLYGIWSNMKQRCNNPRSTSYKWYGAKGIEVCEAWNDFAVCKLWAELKNYKEGLSIDNTGNYEPNNCQWLTKSENAKKQWVDKSRLT